MPTILPYNASSALPGLPVWQESYTSTGKLLRISGADPSTRLAIAKQLLGARDYWPKPASLVAEHCTEELLSNSLDQDDKAVAPYVAQYWVLLARALDDPSTVFYEVPRKLVLALSHTMMGPAGTESHYSKQEIVSAAAESMLRIISRIKGLGVADIGTLLESVVQQFLMEGQNIVSNECMEGILNLYGRCVERTVSGKRLFENALKAGLPALGELITSEETPAELREKAEGVIEKVLLKGGILEVCKKLLDHTSYFTILFSWIARDAKVTILQRMVPVILRKVTIAVKRDRGISDTHSSLSRFRAHAVREDVKGRVKLPVEIQAPIMLFKALCASLRRRLGKVDSGQDQRRVFRAICELFKTANQFSIYHQSYEGALEKGGASGLSVSGEVAAIFLRLLICLQQTNRLRRIVEPAIEAGNAIISFSFGALEPKAVKIFPLLTQLTEQCANRFELEHVISLLVSLIVGYRRTRQIPYFVSLLSRYIGKLGRAIQCSTFQNALVGAVRIAPQGHIVQALNCLTAQLSSIIDHDDSDDERITTISGRLRLFEEAVILAVIIVEAAPREQLAEAGSSIRSLAALIRSGTGKSSVSTLWLQAAVCQTSRKGPWSGSRDLVDSIVTTDDWRMYIDDSSQSRSTSAEFDGSASYQLARARLCVGITHIAALEAQKTMLLELVDAESCRKAVVRACKASLSRMLGYPILRAVAPSVRSKNSIMTEMDERGTTLLLRSLATVLPLLQRFSLLEEVESADVKMLICNFLISSLVVSSSIESFNLLDNADFLEPPIVRERLGAVCWCLGSRMLVETGCASTQFTHQCDLCEYGTSSLRAITSVGRWKVILAVLNTLTCLLPCTNNLTPNICKLNSFALEAISASVLTANRISEQLAVEQAAFTFFEHLSNQTFVFDQGLRVKLIDLSLAPTGKMRHRVFRKCIESFVIESHPRASDSSERIPLREVIGKLESDTQDKRDELTIMSHVLKAIMECEITQQSRISDNFPWLSFLRHYIDLISSSDLHDIELLGPCVVALTILVDFSIKFELDRSAFGNPNLSGEISTILRHRTKGILEQVVNICLGTIFLSKHIDVYLSILPCATDFLASFWALVLQSKFPISGHNLSSLIMRFVSVATINMAHENETYRRNAERLLDHLLKYDCQKASTCIVTSFLSEAEELRRCSGSLLSTVSTIRGINIVVCGLPHDARQLLTSGRVLTSGKYTAAKAVLAAMTCATQLCSWEATDGTDNSTELLNQGVVAAIHAATFCISRPTGYSFETHQVQALLKHLVFIVGTRRWVESQQCRLRAVELCSCVVRHYGNGNVTGSVGILQSVSQVMQRLLKLEGLICPQLGKELSRLFGYIADRTAKRSEERKFIARCLLEEAIVAVTKISNVGTRRVLGPGVGELMGLCSHLELTEILLSLRPGAKAAFKILREEYMTEKYRGSV